MEYIQDERQQHEKSDYYFARLIAEVRRSWVKDPSKVEAEDFLITYKQKATQTVSTMKDFFCFALGINRKKK